MSDLAIPQSTKPDDKSLSCGDVQPRAEAKTSFHTRRAIIVDHTTALVANSLRRNKDQNGISSARLDRLCPDLIARLNQRLARNQDQPGAVGGRGANGWRVILTSVRPHDSKDTALFYLERAGLRPSEALFNEHALIHPHHIKERMLHEHILPRYGRASLLAIDGDMRSRMMYAGNQIDAVAPIEFLNWL